MSDTPSPPDVPLFDVYVSLPADTSVSAIDPKTLCDAGLPPGQADALIKAFRNGPKAKIGSSVTRERGDKAKALFAKTGLVVTVEPLLGLAAAPSASDGLFACPACNQRVTLPENRQCPSCGVFVDKADEAFLLKRKIMQQERAKIEFAAAREISETDKKNRQAMEAALRAQIREELEAEYGIQRDRGLFRGKAGLLRAAGLLGLVTASFVSGQNLPSIDLPWGKKAATPASVDQMLKVGLGASVAGNPALTAAAAASAASSGAPDDIANDPMMQAIGGHRVGAKGPSMEQALSAISVIAKSAPLQTAAGGTGAASAATAATAVPPQIKLTMQTEFAVTLAALGQSGRAQGVLRAIAAAHHAKPSDAQATRMLKMADLQVQAYALASLPAGPARHAADTLRSVAGALPDAADRTLAFSRVGVILSQQPQLPPELAHAFLMLAAESLKTVADTPQKPALVGQWMVSMAQVLLAEATRHASAGRWAQSRAVTEAFDHLLGQAPDAHTLIGLHTLYSGLHRLHGQQDLASQSLSAALSVASELQSLADRATALRTIAELGGAAARVQMQPAIDNLVALLTPSLGPDKAQALTQLALLYARAGAQSLSDRFSQRAESATGLTPAERLEIKSDLVVRTDLEMARALHTAGNYPASEVVLLRVSDYLF